MDKEASLNEFAREEAVSPCRFSSGLQSIISSIIRDFSTTKTKADKNDDLQRDISEDDFLDLFEVDYDFRAFDD